MSQAWHTKLVGYNFSYLKVFILPALHVGAGEVSSEILLYYTSSSIGWFTVACRKINFHDSFFTNIFEICLQESVLFLINGLIRSFAGNFNGYT
jgi:hypothetical protein